MKARVAKCGLESTRNRVMLTVSVSWGAKHDTDALTTKTGELIEGSEVAWDEASNVLIFGGPPELPSDATVQFIIKEKGVHDDADRDSVLKRLGKGIIAGGKVLGEALRGRATLGVPRANTQAFSLRQALESGRRCPDGFSEISLPIEKGGSSDFVTFQVRWMDFRAVRDTVGWAPRIWPPAVDKRMFLYVIISDEMRSMKPWAYMNMECPEVLKVVRKYYEADDLCDKAMLDKPPPVRRIVAVHGVNVKTDTMYALRVNTLRVKPMELHSRFVLDDQAELVESVPGLCMSGGMVYEQSGGSKYSGDGVVPFDSMEYCRAWAGHVDLQVKYLDDVDHRGLLKDPGFHDLLRQACRRWQAAKDSACSDWWDFPAEVAGQLNAARAEGRVLVNVKVRNYDYEIDLQKMVQRNLRTGTERTVRIIDDM
eukprot:CAMPEP_0115363512 /NCGR_PEP_ID=MMETSP0270-20121206/103281_1 /TAXON_ID=71861 /ORGANISM="Scrippsiella trochoidea, Strain CCMP3099" /LENGTH=424 /DNA_ID=CAMNT_0002786161 /DNA_START=204 /DNA_END=1478 /DNA_ORIENTATION=+